MQYARLQDGRDRDVREGGEARATNMVDLVEREDRPSDDQHRIGGAPVGDRLPCLPEGLFGVAGAQDAVRIPTKGRGSDHRPVESGTRRCSAPGVRLRFTTETRLDEPDADGGFISWLDIEILERDANDGELVVGKARAAIIHAAVAGRGLYDAMDADSGELEALYSVYFDDGYFKEQFAEGVGSDLLYVSDIELAPAYRGKNIELALVRRLCDTLGSGSELVVVPYGDEAEAAHWRAIGFRKTRGAPGLMHLNQAFVHPRVVRDDRDDRFRAFRAKPTSAAEKRRRLH